MRVELKSTGLAAPPPPAEGEAIIIAVRQALGPAAPGRRAVLSPQQAAWRFGGRWWVFPRLWTTCGEVEDRAGD
jgi:hypothetical protein